LRDNQLTELAVRSDYLFGAEKVQGHSSGVVKDTVTLSGFMLEVIDSLAPSLDWQPEKTVDRAARHYLAERTLKPPGWACLPLSEDLPEAGREEPTRTIELNHDTIAELRAEAAAQGVSLDALVAHAVTYMWAAENPREAVIRTASARRRRTGTARRDDRSRT
jgi:hypothetical protein